jgi:DNA invertase Pin-like site-specific DNA recombinase
LGRILGYARTSLLEQELQPQLKALRAAGVEDKFLFFDDTKDRGAAWTNLDACLRELETGDTLVIWRIDRIGRSISHLLGILETLRSREIGFKSLCDECIDTTNGYGEIISGVFSSLSRFAEMLLKERARNGVETGRARGRKGGRKPLACNDPRVRAAKAMSLDGDIPVSEICNTLRISRATYYRFLALEGD